MPTAAQNLLRPHPPERGHAPAAAGATRRRGRHSSSASCGRTDRCCASISWAAPPAQRAGAMAQAGWWTPHVNLTFVESTDNDAEIRVAFDPSDGAWSYIGTDCRSIPANQPTMNLGFEDGGTAAHEFGHAIGLGHEHQNPQGGIEWNEPEVIRDLSGPPNSWTAGPDPPQRARQVRAGSAPRLGVRSEVDHALLLPRPVDQERRRHLGEQRAFRGRQGLGGDDVPEIDRAVGHAADRRRRTDGGQHRHSRGGGPVRVRRDAAGHLHHRDRRRAPM